MEPHIHVVEVLLDVCGHISPGWLPFACHVALVQIGTSTALFLDGDLVIGDEAYLRDTARLYVDAVFGSL